MRWGMNAPNSGSPPIALRAPSGRCPRPARSLPGSGSPRLPSKLRVASGLAYDPTTEVSQAQQKSSRNCRLKRANGWSDGSRRGSRRFPPTGAPDCAAQGPRGQSHPRRQLERRLMQGAMARVQKAPVSKTGDGVGAPRWDGSIPSPLRARKACTDPVSRVDTCSGAARADEPEAREIALCGQA